LFKIAQDYLQENLVKVSKRAALGFYGKRFSSVGTGLKISGRPIIAHAPSGTIRAGRNLTLNADPHPIEIYAAENAVVSIGNNVYIDKGVMITAARRIDIGNFTIVGTQTVILDSDWRGIDGAEPHSAPVKIGNHVWIGLRVIILKGVTIGDNAIVGAGSVVTRDIATNNIAAGCPAKKIGSTKTGCTDTSNLQA
jgi:acetyltransferase-like isoleucine patch superfamily enzyme